MSSRLEEIKARRAKVSAHSVFVPINDGLHAGERAFIVNALSDIDYLISSIENMAPVLQTYRDEVERLQAENAALRKQLYNETGGDGTGHYYSEEDINFPEDTGGTA